MSNGTHSLTAVAYNSTTHTGSSSAAFDVTVQTATVTSNDGTASGSNALAQYVNQVTGTDIVSHAEFQAGFTVTGHATAGATVKIALDNDRTDGTDQLGLVQSTVTADASGNWSYAFTASDADLLTATHNTYGSGIHKLTAWTDTDASGTVNGTEVQATRLFLVADGTATTADTGTVAQNYSVQDKVTGDAFVYYYGDPDGNGVGMWTQQDSGDTAGNPGLVATDRDADANGLGDWDYYNTTGVAVGTVATPANTALGMVTNVAAQTFEFHMGKANASAMVYGDAATLAGNHTTEGSNTSSLPTLDQVLGLYAANFGDASAGGSTVGAIQPITNTSSYNGYVAAENNNPSGWDTNLWTSAPAPSGHINLDLSSGYLVDRTDGTNLWIAPVL